MVPRLENPDDVREAASYLRFPPEGVRGLALLTRGAGLGEVGHTAIRDLNDPILGIFQIESGAAVDNAAGLAAIDGVDVLFVGPTDLSHSLGIPGAFAERPYREALARVVDAVRAAGKAAGILLRSPAEMAEYVDLGFTFVGLGSDASFVAQGAVAAVAARPT